MSQIVQITLFDYQQLDPETRIVVQQEDKEFDLNIDKSSTSFIYACKNLQRIHEALRYKRPGFVDYCGSKSGLSERTAYKMLDVAKMFAESANISISSREALYLLAAPSTPDKARQEILDRAEQGETITPGKTQSIISSHKAAQLSANGKPPAPNNRPLFADDPNLDQALDDQDNFVCQDCGEVLDFKVWHCLTCDRHWPIDYESCPSCATDEPKPVATTSQELSVLLSHESTEWYTPAEYIEAVRQVLGTIDLDPATCDIPQSWIKATDLYTLADNGLIQPWNGRVFLNPPYSKTEGQSNQELWSQKLIAEYEAGRVTEAILLVKASIGYNWFDRLFDAYPVCLVRGLISFIKPDGQPGGPAKLGSAFFYLGPNYDRFVQTFSRFGRVIPIER